MVQRRTNYILDGYNVIHRVPGLEARLGTSLAHARDGLVRLCRTWLATRGDVDLFWVVFDGDSSVCAHEEQGGPGIRLCYTQTGESADQRILQMVESMSGYANCVAISDDRYVSEGVKRLGGKVLTVEAFFRTSVRTKASRRGAKAGGDDPKVSGSAAVAITQDLMRMWSNC